MLNPNYGGECFFWSILIFLMNRENFHEGQPNPIEQNKVLDCERAQYIVVKISEKNFPFFLILALYHHATAPPQRYPLLYSLMNFSLDTRSLTLQFSFFKHKKKLYINKFIVLNSNHIKTCDFLDFMTGSVSCSNRI